MDKVCEYMIALGGRVPFRSHRRYPLLLTTLRDVDYPRCYYSYIARTRSKFKYLIKKKYIFIFITSRTHTFYLYLQNQINNVTSAYMKYVIIRRAH